MTMTRKHFRAFTRVLHDNKDFKTSSSGIRAGYNIGWQTCVQAVAQVLAELNSRFDHDKFVQACENGEDK